MARCGWLRRVGDAELSRVDSCWWPGLNNARSQERPGQTDHCDDEEEDAPAVERVPFFGFGEPVCGQ